MPEQTIDLIAAGYTAAQIDSNDFKVEFGGRIRSAQRVRPTSVQIHVIFSEQRATSSKRWLPG